MIKVDKRKAFNLIESAVTMTHRIQDITTNVDLEDDVQLAEALLEIRDELKRQFNIYETAIQPEAEGG